jgi:hypothetical protein
VRNCPVGRVVGYDSIVAGWHKFTTPARMDGSGQGTMGFWKSALGTTPGRGAGHHVRLVP